MKRFEACDNMVVIFVDEEHGEGAAGLRAIDPTKAYLGTEASCQNGTTELEARDKFPPPPMSLGSNSWGSNLTL